MDPLITNTERDELFDRFHYSDETKKIILKEDLLPVGLINRLHTAFPGCSGFGEHAEFLFNEKKHYSGLKGFREIVDILRKNKIEIGHIEERELL
jgi:lysine 2,3-aminomutase